MTLTRRAALGAAVTAAAVVTTDSLAAAKTVPQRPRPIGLKPMAGSAQPITAQERQARLAKVQGLMQEKKVAALLVESGSTLEYFTGIHWWTSERVTAAIIPANGQVIIVTPFFESPSIREMLQVPGEIRPWQEDESPFELIAKSVSGMGEGPLAVDSNVRFFITDAVTKAAGGHRATVPGGELVRACRMVKSPAELALMQLANDITLTAIRYVHANLQLGMQTADVAKLTGDATTALGGGYDFSLALLNEASAFPHGSKVVQTVRDGSVILIDAGCTLHGYQSDISRSWIFGEPTARQREVWNMVKRGQEIALETAKIGTPVGSIDKAVRAFYESKGWSKNYALPGLSHRTGHGIGMDGHENPYLVRSDTTPLAAGMCFSDEPGLYIPGEFGIRLEDCWHMTEQGPKLFTELARSIDQPV
ncbi:MAG TPA: Xaa-Pro peptidase family protein [Steroidobacteraceae bacterium]|nr:Xaa-Pro peptidase family protein [Steroidobacteraceae bacterium]